MDLSRVAFARLPQWPVCISGCSFQELTCHLDGIGPRHDLYGCACAAASGSVSTWRVSFQNRITGRESSFS